MHALQGIVRKIDSWLASRQRISADHDELARMSDRELADIGIDRASVSHVADGGCVRGQPF